MRNILTIAQCEFIEMLKTKTFLISVLFAPLMMGGILFFAEKLAQRPAGPRAPMTVGLTDLSGQMTENIKNRLLDYNKKNASRQILFESLEAQNDPNTVQNRGKAYLRSGKLNAYVVIDKDIITASGKVYFYTYKPKPSDADISWTVENMINDVVVEQRCKAQNIPSKLLNEIRYVPTERIEIGETSQQQRVQSQSDMMMRMMAPFFMMFMIYMGIMVIGGQVLSSIIEEKSSRIIEIILSAVSPFEFMAGKILGLCGVGLAIVSLWTLAAFGTARTQNLAVDMTGLMFFYLIIYFVLGFVLLTSLMAAMGAICNTIKESQSLMTPVVMLLVLPMISWFNLVQSPNGLYAKVLSYIPPLTPLVMVLRLSSTSDVSVIEVIVSITWLFISMLAAIWFAGRVFRTGILMYGKRPSLREVFRWLRQS
jgi:ABC-2 type transport system permease protein